MLEPRLVLIHYKNLSVDTVWLLLGLLPNLLGRGKGISFGCCGSEVSRASCEELGMDGLPSTYSHYTILCTTSFPEQSVQRCSCDSKAFTLL